MMFQPPNHHSHPPPLPRPDKPREPRLRIGKSLPTPCTDIHCQQCVEHGRQARASSGMAPGHPGKVPFAAQPSLQGIVHCMLCDTSGHGHGTVRLIFEPQSPLHFRPGQTLRVLLPGGCGPEILITSLPGSASVMHGKLLLAQGESLPAQFGPDAAFGWMFQVCLRHKIHPN